MKLKSVITVTFGLLVCGWVTFVTCENTLNGQDQKETIRKNYTMRLQPELDALNVDFYLYSDRLFNFQLKCILHDKPCDSVGQWLVPRIPEILVGGCPKCTPIQKQRMQRVLLFVENKKPDVYQALMDKYVNNQPKTRGDGDEKATTTAEETAKVINKVESSPQERPTAPREDEDTTTEIFTTEKFMNYGS